MLADAQCTWATIRALTVGSREVEVVAIKEHVSAVFSTLHALFSQVQHYSLHSPHSLIVMALATSAVSVTVTTAMTMTVAALKAQLVFK